MLLESLHVSKVTFVQNTHTHNKTEKKKEREKKKHMEIRKRVRLLYYFKYAQQLSFSLHYTDIVKYAFTIGLEGSLLILPSTTTTLKEHWAVFPEGSL